MFLDTSGLYCFFNRKYWRHKDAVEFIHSASFLLTSSYVLAEFIPLCYARKLDQNKTLDFVADLMANPLVEIVWVDESLHRQAFELLRHRRDKTYSLCDAVSS